MIQVLLILGSLLLLIFLPKCNKTYSAIPFILGLIAVCSNNAFQPNHIAYFVPLFLMTWIVLAFYLIKKDIYFFLYLLFIPVIFCCMIYFLINYAGVINPRWPLLITSFAMASAMYLTSRTQTAWKVIVNCCLIIVIALIMIFCRPTYTLSEASAKISNELNKEVNPARLEEMRIMYTIPGPSMHVNYSYVLEMIEDDILSTFTFNPVTGDWKEWYSRPIE